MPQQRHSQSARPRARPRDGFRGYWRWKSRHLARAAEAVALEIADELADKGRVVRDRFVPTPDVRTLAARSERALAEGDFRHARIGRGAQARVDADVRGDRVRWFDPATGSAAERRYGASIETVRMTLNRELTLGLFGFEVQRTVYEVGAFYRTHLDRFASARHRTVSVILYLNPTWTIADGGRLRLYLDRPDREPYAGY